MGGKLEYFSELQLLVEVNWEAWFLLTPAQKVALIDHELCHFGREEDEKTGEVTYVTLPHDVEEFAAVVQRWGIWKHDLERFARAVTDAPQGELFTGAFI